MKLLIRAANSFAWGFFICLLISGMGKPDEGLARSDPSRLDVRILNVHNGQSVRGSSLSLRIRVSPAPTPRNPVFLRVLVNGQIHNVIKVIHRIQTVDLNNLPQGKNRIEFVPDAPDSPGLTGRTGSPEDASGLCDGGSAALPVVSSGLFVRVGSP